MRWPPPGPTAKLQQMAQTKRKRRSKHRGTAAGSIEARGRTGRPLSAEERKKQDRMTARERRLNTPPTWRSAFTRAAVAAVIVFLFILLTAKGKDKLVTALVFTIVALVIYIPAGYYLEVTLYRRRQRKKMAEGGGSK
jgi:Flp pilus assembly protein TadB